MKNNKLYLGLICVLVVLVPCILNVLIQDNGIALGNVALTEEVRPKEWQDIIAADVNGENLLLKVDGLFVPFEREHMYMDHDMNLMIPVKLFPKVFRCALNSVKGASVQIQRGSDVITAYIDRDFIDVNGKRITLPQAMSRENGIYYMNSKVLEYGLGYQHEWNSSENTLKLVDVRKQEIILPPRYSYKEVGRLPSIKNQGSYSTCWAFAALMAVETSLQPQENYHFSVDNMVGNNGYSSSARDGGDYTRAIAYLTSWRGPVLEEDDVYGDGKVNKDAPPAKHVQEAQMIESKNLEAIKRAVFLYGGVESSLYTSMENAGQQSMYYNSATSAYCYIGTKKPNHDVVIVGWDDNYAKENFSTNLEADGAFICANSWGSEFGEDGLFYVSYYDSNIGIHNVVYTGIENTDNYDHLYQSDICGWVGQLGYEEETAYFANVYTARADEWIKAVGFYATGKNTVYEIYAVENFTDVHSLNKRYLVQSGSFTNAGYYTVKLNTPIAVKAGSKYSVVIKITTPGAVHPIAIEYRAGRATKDVVIEDGEGYISYLGRSWEHVEESKQCNICLKVYTDDAERKGEDTSDGKNNTGIQ